MDSSDNDPGEATGTNTIPASDSAPLELHSSAEAGLPAEGAEGAPRPRRRRRRRRRPEQAAAAQSGATLSDGDDAASPDGDGGDDSGEPDAAEPGGAVEGEPSGEGGDRPILRLRSRRRRHRPPPGADPAAGSGPSEGVADGSADADQPGGETGETAGSDTPVEGPRSAEGGEAPTRPLGTRPPRSRNRRRRGPPVVVAKTPDGEVELRGLGAPADRGAARPAGPPHSRTRRPRRRAPGDRPEAGQAPAPGAAVEQQPSPGRQEHGQGARGGGGEGRRDNRGPRDGRPGGRPGERRDGRGGPPGRGAPPRPERKLYAIDAVVDRGFEDIEEEDGGSRRSGWTIVKRVTADQVSRKPVSTVYVLQREEGGDAEFPGLGAARSAVNKTIVHPEKLTRSKAEHVSAKK